MNVYFINSYDISDKEEFSKYGPLVLEVLKKYDGKVIVSDTEAIAIEGNPKNMNSVIMFPSKEAALNCYNDPDYQKARLHRLKSTNNCTMLIAEEYHNQ